MKAADEQGGVEQSTGSVFYNTNAAYSMNLAPRKLTFTLSFNYSQNKALDITSSTLGPVLSLSKTMLDKRLRITGSASMNNTYAAGSLTNRIVSVRGNSTYSIKQKHNIALSVVGLNRSIQKEGSGKDFTEFTGTLGYSYSF
jgi:hypothetical protein